MFLFEYKINFFFQFLFIIIKKAHKKITYVDSIHVQLLHSDVYLIKVEKQFRFFFSVYVYIFVRVSGVLTCFMHKHTILDHKDF